TSRGSRRWTGWCGARTGWRWSRGSWASSRATRRWTRRRPRCAAISRAPNVRCGTSSRPPPAARPHSRRRASSAAGSLPPPSRAEREVWDLIAPPAGRTPPLSETRELGRRVAAAALARHPALDPRPYLPAVRHPVVLAHGYYDQLIPYAETLRLHAALPAGCP